MKSPDNLAKAVVQELVRRIHERLDHGNQLTAEELKFITDVHKSQKAEERDLSGEEDTFKPFETAELKKMVGRNHGAIGGN